MGQGFDPDQCCLIFSLKVYRAQITTMSNLILYFVIYHCLKGCFHFITNKGISAGSNPSQLNYARLPGHLFKWREGRHQVDLFSDSINQAVSSYSAGRVRD